MLIHFSVNNFRSFLDTQHFTFAASSDRLLAATHTMRTGLKSTPRVSRSAVVFGPNGSGKSNLVGAIAMMRDLVLHSTTFSPAELASRYSPFLLDRSQDRPTEFEMEVLIDRVKYRYAFAYDARSVCRERLLVFPTGKSQRWFERHRAHDVDKECWAPFSNNFVGPRTLWRDATRAQALFLSTAAQLNAHQLQPLFRWFEHGLALVFGSDKFDPTQTAGFVQDARHKRHMLEFMRGAGLHVHDVRVAAGCAPGDGAVERALIRQPLPRPAPAGGALRASPVSSPQAAAIEFSRLRNDGSAVWMQSADESTGAQRLVNLFGPLLTAVQRGQLLLVDEFDASLHPLVALYLIELINDPEISKNRAQLLFTSHNASLMDMGVLRRDEIWLMELDHREASTLKRVWLSPSPPRKNELIGRQYLVGRYGAVPATRPAERVSQAPPSEPARPTIHDAEITAPVP